MIKAIQTEYNGYLFRSRLEARWAVFFDELGIRYKYEEFGFENNGFKWLPDFYLPDYGTWIEVKGGKTTEKDAEKMFNVLGSIPTMNGSWRNTVGDDPIPEDINDLLVEMGKTNEYVDRGVFGLIVLGDIPNVSEDNPGLVFYPAIIGGDSESNSKDDDMEFWEYKKIAVCFGRFIHDGRPGKLLYTFSDRDFYMMSLVYDVRNISGLTSGYIPILQGFSYHDNHTEWTPHVGDYDQWKNHISEEFSPEHGILFLNKEYNLHAVRNVCRAYRKARQARFEHGERKTKLAA